METNVGGIDKKLRIAVGVVLVGLAIFGIGTPWTWIGVLPLATGLMGWCPAYLPFGIKTCSTK
ncbi:MAG: DUF2892 domain-containing protein [Betaproteobacteria bacterium]|nr:DUF2892 domain-containing protein [Betaproteobacteria bacterium]